MSLEAIAWALRQPIKDPIAKLILISLADHHNRPMLPWSCPTGRSRKLLQAQCNPQAAMAEVADPLTEVLRNGARALLVQAVEAEVAEALRHTLIDDV